MISRAIWPTFFLLHTDSFVFIEAIDTSFYKGPSIKDVRQKSGFLDLLPRVTGLNKFIENNNRCSYFLGFSRPPFPG